MKKSFLAAIGAVFTVALASCGGSSVNLENPESAVNASVEMAEKAVPVTDASLIGNLPSIEVQYFAARDSLKQMYKDASKALLDNVKSERDLKELQSKGELLGNACQVAESQLKDKYLEKINPAAKEIIGKEVPVEFDKEQYSAAKVVVKDATVSSSLIVSIKFEATLTPCASLGSYVDWVNWEYLTANNEKASYGAGTVKGRAKIGEPFNIELNIPAKKLQDVTRISFIKTK